jgi:hypothetical protein
MQLMGEANARFTILSENNIKSVVPEDIPIDGAVPGVIFDDQNRLFVHVVLPATEAAKARPLNRLRQAVRALDLHCGVVR